MTRLSISTTLATAALAIGCGGGSVRAADRPDEDAATSEGTDRATASGAMVSRRRPGQGKTLKVVSSSYGRVVADRRGEALYLFDRERTKSSRCYGECARAWPPVLTRGRPRAGRGVKARLLGTARRANGKLQVTYRNHPLYYYVADAPGRILCQNVDEFGGLWLVVKPSGSPVRGAG
jgi:predicted lipoprotein with Yx(FWY)xxD motif